MNAHARLDAGNSVALWVRYWPQREILDVFSVAGGNNVKNAITYRGDEARKRWEAIKAAVARDAK